MARKQALADLDRAVGDAAHPSTIEYPRLRQFFHHLNRYLMVPFFRLGFGPFIGSPFGGYIMVVKTIGRKSGKVRYTPVNYAVCDGNVYCLAGWKRYADWYQNLRANPHVELMMPSANIAGIAEEVTDPEEWLRITRQVLRNAGLAGFLLGANPFTASDEVVHQKAMGTPAIRIRSCGVANGPGDPGGWLWILATGLFIWLIFKPRRGER